MRADAPMLDLLGPPCPLCGEETDHEDGFGWSCQYCGAWWDDYGRFDEWCDNEVEQCPATKKEQQCLLEEEHSGSHKSHSFDWVEV